MEFQPVFSKQPGTLIRHLRYKVRPKVFYGSIKKQYWCSKTKSTLTKTSTSLWEKYRIHRSICILNDSLSDNSKAVHSSYIKQKLCTNQSKIFAVMGIMSMYHFEVRNTFSKIGSLLAVTQSCCFEFEPCFSRSRSGGTSRVCWWDIYLFADRVHRCRTHERLDGL